MRYYYADSQNRAAGPVSGEQLQALIQAGALKPDPMVIVEGGTEWRPWSTYKAQPASIPATGFGATAPAPSLISQASAAPKPASFQLSRSLLGDCVAQPLNKIKGYLNSRFVTSLLEASRNAGHWAVLVGGILGLILCVVTALRENSLSLALIGLAFLVVLAIGQYVAMQFLGAGDALIANTPHRISSAAVLDCLGLAALLGALSMMGGVLVLIFHVQGLEQVLTLLPPLVGCALLVCVAALAFNPQLVNISVGAGSAGEEAVGVLGFLLKAGLKMLPLSFLLLSVVGCLLIAALFSAQMREYGELIPLPGHIPATCLGQSVVLIACFVPFGGYLLYLLLGLALEVIRALLAIPEKMAHKA